MSARLSRLLALAALLMAVTPAAAGAALPKDVRSVIADYREDGTIAPCRHTLRAYRDALKAVEADAEAYAADLPVAVEAARDARKRKDCTAASNEDAGANGRGAAGGTGAAPTPTPTPAPPVPTPAPLPSPETQAAPPSTIDGLPETATPPTTPPAPTSPANPAAPTTPTTPTTPQPSTQEVVPEPPAPAGSGAGTTPGTPSAQTNQPDVALERASSDDGPAPLPVIVLGGLGLAAALAALAVLAARRFGWGEQRLAGVRHAVGEAGYRTGGTWQSFTDWLRLGR